jgi:hypothetical protein
LWRGVPVIGLQPSYIFSFRDKILAILPGEDFRRVTRKSFLLEEFIVKEVNDERFAPVMLPIGTKAPLHGHCNQKAFGATGAVEKVLRMIPGLTVEPIDSSGYGMASIFGYQSETIDVLLSMPELSLALSGKSVNFIRIND